MTESDTALPAQALAGFGEFVEEVLGLWQVPGVAIVVVREEEVIYCRGFGLRNVEKGLPVTPQTLFGIGSCTKAITATSVGILVDEGKLDWDQPVRDYLPTFRMHDSVASERMTPRDLLTHRSGLPRHDFVWYGSPRTRSEIFDRLRYLEPSNDFRSVYGYQNLMYMTAGYLVGQLSGGTWEEFVQQRILDPLGMQDTNFFVRDSQETDDYALPYIEKDGQANPIPFRNIDTIGPAGSINSNIVDMVRWLQLNLNKGRYGQQQIISEGNLGQIHTPQIVLQDPLKYHELLYASHGMGWLIQPYRGHLLLHHAGSIDGFTSLTSFMPHEGIGVVALTNLHGTHMPFLLTYNVYDRLLGLKPVPWSERFRKEHDEAKAAVDKGKGKVSAERKPDTRPSHPLAEYAGDFEHAGYGTVSVAMVGDGLQVTLNSVISPLEHYHYDTFELTWGLSDARMMVTFHTDVKGKISGLSIPLEPAIEDIHFARVPARSMRVKGFLERFTGTYLLMDTHFLVCLKGEGTLVGILPGQAEMELVPYQGTEFTVKGLSGSSVEFMADESGAVTHLELTQPNRVYTARRVKDGPATE